jgi:hypothetical protein
LNGNHLEAACGSLFPAAHAYHLSSHSTRMALLAATVHENCVFVSERLCQLSRSRQFCQLDKKNESALNNNDAPKT